MGRVFYNLYVTSLLVYKQWRGLNELLCVLEIVILCGAVPQQTIEEKSPCLSSISCDAPQRRREKVRRIYIIIIIGYISCVTIFVSGSILYQFNNW